MTAPRGARNRTLAGIHVDSSTRDDGRYLLYYSWPDEPRSEAEDGAGRPATPDRGAQAWTPEAGPPEDGGV